MHEAPGPANVCCFQATVKQAFKRLRLEHFLLGESVLEAPGPSKECHSQTGCWFHKSRKIAVNTLNY